MKILLIIPAYNEENNILKVYNQIKNHGNVDYIIINDGSIDGTRKILETRNLNHINLIHNLGIGGAVQTGYLYALKHNYDIAIQFDGDNQHNIEYIDEMIKLIQRKKADMVIGSRFINKDKAYKSTKTRVFGIKLLSCFMFLTTGKMIQDVTSGLRACNKDIIKLFAYDYPLEYPEPVSTVFLLKNKYKVLETPVIMNKRIGGKSSIRAWKSIYYIFNVCISILILSARRKK